MKGDYRMFKIIHRESENSLVKRLTSNQLRVLLRRLPEPVSKHTIGTVDFEIYKAKDLLNPNWINEALFRLVLDARMSYYRYGDFTLLDEYDKKSAIYLVRVRYKLPLFGIKQGCPVEEWLSTRLIPVRGDPYGIEDFELFIYQGKTLITAFQERLFDPHGRYLDSFVASSRTCGIRPYCKSEKDENKLKKEAILKHKYTAICFALIHQRFWEECLISDFPFEYIVGTVVNKFMDKALVIVVNGKEFIPNFIPIHQFLKIGKGEEIKLDRHRKDFYTYRFPTYFLNTHQLIDLLLKLIEGKKLSNNTIQYYLQTNLTLKEILRQDNFTVEYLRKLNRLLTIHGPIKGAVLTGEQLRKILDKEVDDAPELRITKIEDWIKSIKYLLHAAKTHPSKMKY